MPKSPSQLDREIAAALLAPKVAGRGIAIPTPSSKLLKQADELLSNGRYRLALARAEAAYQASLDAEDKQGEKDALRMIEGINDILENG